MSGLSAAVFADLMAVLGPFEACPDLAVAVSGGADSLALALLADNWARLRGGKIVALTVDHTLRSESGQEAQQVGRWLAARGIRHHILLWQDSKPGPGLQAAARDARYRLLQQWCRDQHILHLLLAHHADDQAETLLLRLARGSGVDGLAAMAGCALHQDLQHLRPLLTVPRHALRAYLQAERQGWIEDPSNDADRFDRVRWRKILASEQIAATRLTVTARQMGRARQALEHHLALLAVEAVTVADAGYGWIDPAKLVTAPDELALRLLSNLCRTIGGGLFPPRLASIERLLAACRGELTRRTVAGCVFAPCRQKILVYREVSAVAPPVLLTVDQPAIWDNRFSVRLQHGEAVHCGALGVAAARQFRDLAERQEIPLTVLPSMPAIKDYRGILAVPPLGYQMTETELKIGRWGFTPLFPLISAGFGLVRAAVGTI